MGFAIGFLVTNYASLILNSIFLSIAGGALGNIAFTSFLMSDNESKQGNQK